MPDFDNGHIFLTTLAPIKPGAPEDNPQVSHEQCVRTALATMPVARQSPATADAKENSPFARNLRNHLARMFVLNDTIYNGRITQNPLLAILEGLVRRNGADNPLIPRKVDRLNASYLVFCADIDAITQDGDPLPAHLSAEQQRDVRAAYARELWETMGEELTTLYANCYGFEGVDSAEKFAAYLDRCHVETTMPFHDYYFQTPDLKPARLLIPLAIATVIPLLVGLIGLGFSLFGVSAMPLLGWSSTLTWIGGFSLTALLGLLTVRYTNARGAKPFPLGKYDDLPSVLKAVYIQQKTADFVIDNQGASPEALYEAFGAFISAHDPENPHAKTQKPGVISSADPDTVTA